jgi:hypothetical protein
MWHPPHTLSLSTHSRISSARKEGEMFEFYLISLLFVYDSSPEVLSAGVLNPWPTGCMQPSCIFIIGLLCQSVWCKIFLWYQKTCFVNVVSVWQ